MARLRMVREHGGDSVEEGKITVERVVDEMSSTLDKYVDSTEWNGNRTEARLKGKHVQGTLTVDDTMIRIDLKLSFVASLVKNQIEARIDRALKEHC